MVKQKHLEMRGLSPKTPGRSTFSLVVLKDPSPLQHLPTQGSSPSGSSHLACAPHGAT